MTKNNVSEKHLGKYIYFGVTIYYLRICTNPTVHSSKILLKVITKSNC